MDTPITLQPILGALKWLLLAILPVCLLKLSWAKGHIGELLVHIFAHWQLDKHTYRRLHDLTLSSTTW